MKKAFGRHEVWIDTACLHVGKEGVTFKVKNDGETIGTLKITDTHVYWAPKGKRLDKSGMPWSKFMAHMSTIERKVK